MPNSSKSPTTVTRTVDYDVAEQLRTPEEMAAYLDAWLTEAPDDKNYTSSLWARCTFFHGPRTDFFYTSSEIGMQA